MPAYWTLKSLNVEKILAVKYTTYASAQRKPDKNKKFRPAEIRTLTSGIPVQCSNQYVLYCHWTVSNTSHIYFTLPPHLYSVHIQYTFSKVLVVYIKRYLIKGSCELFKFYGNSVMLTSIVLVKLWETKKLGEAQHSITHKFNDTDSYKSKNSGPH